MDQADQPPRRDDPRPAQTRELVLHAARTIIASQGQSAVTPTRLVALSGVARSTIYRHWPDADAIIADALQPGSAATELDRTGDIETDLRTYLHRLRDALSSPRAAIIISQAELAERDEQAAATLAANARYRNQLIHDLLQDPRSDFDATHAQLVGPLFMQRYFMRKPITDEFIDQVINAYLLTRPTP